jgi:hypothetical protein
MYTRYLGISTDFGEFPYLCDGLKAYAEFDNRHIDCYLLPDFSLFEELIKIIDITKYSRVMVYDLTELGGIENFKKFADLCLVYNWEYSIVKQNLHSDIDIPINYFLSVI